VSPLGPGLEREDEFEVEGRLLTDVRGTLPVKVLSTPASRKPRSPRDGRATEGQRCTLRASLLEVVDGRKPRFDVEVLQGGRTIGVGTHERRIID
jgi:fluoroacetyl-CoA thioesterase